MADEIFTPEEIEKLKKLFTHIDKNNDKSVSASELQAFCTEIGLDVSSDRAKELIEKCDPENTGKVDFDHFAVGMAVVLAKLKVALFIIALFKEMDADGSGYIQASELKQLAKEAGSDIPPQKIDEIVKKCDESGDGKISFEEFIQGLVRYLESQG